MAFSMYSASVPAVMQIFNSLTAILDKAAAHCAAKKIDPSVLLNFRLAPDMFPLSRQVQIMADLAKGMAARLAGVEIPSYPDTESTFDELKARIAKTKDFIKSIPQSKIEGSEDRSVTLKVGGNDMTFKGSQYLVNFVFPNFYFHATMTYAILRHCGMELGKRDFLGGV